MRSINVYKEIVFSNLIKISLSGCKDDIIPEVKNFYSCLKEKGIDTHPQIVTNNMVKSVDNLYVEENEIYVVSSEDSLKKVEGLYKTYEELMWENVVMLEYNGVLLEFQNAVKELKQYIEKNNMKTISSFYTYIPHEIKGSDIFSRKIDMNCFVKIEQE